MKIFLAGNLAQARKVKTELRVIKWATGKFGSYRRLGSFYHIEELENLVNAFKKAGE